MDGVGTLRLWISWGAHVTVLSTNNSQLSFLNSLSAICWHTCSVYCAVARGWSAIVDGVEVRSDLETLVARD